MQKAQQLHFISWRFYVLLGLLTLVVLGLLLRVFDLTVFKQTFLRDQGDQRELRLVNAPAFRGMILDRNGYPLAVSAEVYAAWVNPKIFVASPTIITQLSNLIGIPPHTFNTLLARQHKRSFVYLKRGLSPETANAIKALAIPGIYLQQAYHRYYPEGETTAHVLGFTNVDDKGQEGLELAYNDWLTGQSGEKWVMKDRMGGIIADVKAVREQKPGNDIVLSLDRRIQYLAYSALLDGVKENLATAGTAIVVDVKTGEVLAMVNVPSFNPNGHAVHNKEVIRNRAVTDTFEPGSVIKAFTIASALASGLYQPNSVINTSPGWMRVGHSVIRDEKNNGLLSLGQILQISSNMGATKIVLSLHPDDLWAMLHKVGFGETTNVGFPGEQQGSLVRRAPWGQAVLAALSYGYGLSVTPIQLVSAYMVLANGGVKKPVTLLKQNSAPQGVRVLDKISRG